MQGEGRGVWVDFPGYPTGGSCRQELCGTYRRRFAFAWYCGHPLPTATPMHHTCDSHVHLSTHLSIPPPTSHNPALPPLLPCSPPPTAALVAAVHGRTISGTVKWTDGMPAVGAVAKVYDNDVIGERRVQQRRLRRVSLPAAEAACSAACHLAPSGGLPVVARSSAAGQLPMPATDAPEPTSAAPLSPAAGREYMGQATVSSTGAFAITARDGDWDGCCFSSTRPDLVLEVSRGGGEEGRTCRPPPALSAPLRASLHLPFPPWACPSLGLPLSRMHT